MIQAYLHVMLKALKSFVKRDVRIVGLWECLQTKQGIQ